MPSSDPEGAKPAAPLARTVAVRKSPLSLLPLPCSFSKLVRCGLFRAHSQQLSFRIVLHLLRRLGEGPENP